jgi:hypothetical protein
MEKHAVVIPVKEIIPYVLTLNPNNKQLHIFKNNLTTRSNNLKNNYYNIYERKCNRK